MPSVRHPNRRVPAVIQSAHNNSTKMKSPSVQESAFHQEAQRAESGLLGEFWGFLKDNKKWWLTPILVALALIGLLVIASSSVVAPFIYTLF